MAGSVRVISDASPIPPYKPVNIAGMLVRKIKTVTDTAISAIEQSSNAITGSFVSNEIVPGSIITPEIGVGVGTQISQGSQLSNASSVYERFISRISWIRHPLVPIVILTIVVIASVTFFVIRRYFHSSKIIPELKLETAPPVSVSGNTLINEKASCNSNDGFSESPTTGGETSTQTPEGSQETPPPERGAPDSNPSYGPIINKKGMSSIIGGLLTAFGAMGFWAYRKKSSANMEHKSSETTSPTNSQNNDLRNVYSSAFMLREDHALSVIQSQDEVQKMLPLVKPLAGLLDKPDAQENKNGKVGEPTRKVFTENSHKSFEKKFWKRFPRNRRVGLFAILGFLILGSWSRRGKAVKDTTLDPREDPRLEAKEDSIHRDSHLDTEPENIAPDSTSRSKSDNSMQQLPKMPKFGLYGYAQRPNYVQASRHVVRMETSSDEPLQSVRGGVNRSDFRTQAIDRRNGGSSMHFSPKEIRDASTSPKREAESVVEKRDIATTPIRMVVEGRSTSPFPPKEARDASTSPKREAVKTDIATSPIRMIVGERSTSPIAPTEKKDAPSSPLRGAYTSPRRVSIHTPIQQTDDISSRGLSPRRVPRLPQKKSVENHTSDLPKVGKRNTDASTSPIGVQAPGVGPGGDDEVDYRGEPFDAIGNPRRPPPMVSDWSRKKGPSGNNSFPAATTTSDETGDRLSCLSSQDRSQVSHGRSPALRINMPDWSHIKALYLAEHKQEADPETNGWISAHHVAFGAPGTAKVSEKQQLFPYIVKAMKEQQVHKQFYGRDDTEWVKMGLADDVYKRALNLQRMEKRAPFQQKPV